MKKSRSLHVPISLLLVWLSVLAQQTSGQQPITFQYFYDNLNQLTKVVDSTGVVIEYIYDSVGNILQIKRSVLSSPGALSVFSVGPQRVGDGQTITIYGQGFSTTPLQDLVTINGIAATVLSATPTTLTVMVPSTATSGVVSVTVDGVTTQWDQSLTILPLPVITALTPRSALLGSTVSVTVSGMNLNQSTFASSPGGLSITVQSSSADGTAAVVNVGAVTSGIFAVFATNSAGNSSTILSSSNAFCIASSNGQNDTDGDGFSDGVEVAAGSDPLNPNSTPLTGAVSGNVNSAVFSILNNHPTGPEATVEADSTLFSVLDNHVTGPQTVVETDSVLFSVLNSHLTGSQAVVETDSTLFSVLNSHLTGAQSVAEADSSLFSVLNNHLSGNQAIVETDSSLFSVLNSHLNGVQSLLETDSVLFSIENNANSSASVSKPLITQQSSEPTEQTRDVNSNVPSHQSVNVLLTKLVAADSDGDGLSDDEELVLGTDRFNADTDGDGYPDGLEVTLKSNPLDPNSIPDVRPPGTFSGVVLEIQNQTTLSRNERKGTQDAHSLPPLSSNNDKGELHRALRVRDLIRFCGRSFRTNNSVQ